MLSLLLILGVLVFATSFNEKDSQSYSREDILGEWRGNADELGGTEVILFTENGTSWFTYIPEGDTEFGWLTKNDSWRLDSKIVVEDERGIVMSYEIIMVGNEINLICPEDSTIYKKVSSGKYDKGLEIITMQALPNAFDYSTDGSFEGFWEILQD
ncbi:MAG: hypothetical protein ACLFUW_06195 [Bacteroidales bacterium]